MSKHDEQTDIEVDSLGRRRTRAQLEALDRYNEARALPEHLIYASYNLHLTDEQHAAFRLMTSAERGRAIALGMPVFLAEHGFENLAALTKARRAAQKARKAAR